MEPGSSFAGSVSRATSSARRYTLLRRLAVGGMGELFLARAAGPGGVEKLVAIKRVRPEYANDAEFVTMFLNEARLAATLDHPNVVRTYDLVEEDTGFAMVMEYLHGESLGSLLNAVVKRAARVPLEHIITIALGVAAGLHCAHERRGVDGRPLDIVHRDLSPGNVFITFEGGVKLLDFGIAKATSRTSITVGPARKGKVSYMSPEQCVGHDVDRRSDIFGLGVVLWELCTGRRLFRGDNEFAIMNQITTIDAPQAASVVPQLPAKLSALLGRALCREPDGRFQTAMEFRDALEAFARDEQLLPSDAALGRYLAENCGSREFPSVEPDSEFRNKQTTIVAGREHAVPPRRRWSLVAAVVGGATLGAAAMALPSIGATTTAAPLRSSLAQTVLAQLVPDGQPTELPTTEEPSRVAVAEPEPKPDPKPDPVAKTPQPAPPAPATRKRKKPHKRRPKPKPDPAPAEPAAPIQGVDGLLPRG